MIFEESSIGKHIIFKSCFYSDRGVSVIYLY